MAQYYEDFSGLTTGPGQFPSGDWSKLFNDASYPNDWDVVEDPAATGGKIVTESGTTREVYVYDPVTENDVEILARVNTQNNGVGVFGLCARFSGTDQFDRTGYSLSYDDYFYHSLSVGSWDNGNPTPLGSLSFSQNVGAWHWIRFRVRGDQLKVKLWDAANEEPTAWGIEVTDTTHTSGVTGVYSGQKGESFDVFAVGTGTDDPPVGDTVSQVPDAPSNLNLTQV